MNSKIQCPRYYSTNGDCQTVSLSQALLAGQAPDKGLYLPDIFPSLSNQMMDFFIGRFYYEIAVEVLWPYVSDFISRADLLAICRDAYNFNVPIEPVADLRGVSVMRLDQGPTASFKDFAARLMARLISKIMADAGQQLTILVATSGDTGSAVANAFHNLPLISVVILFPADEVSKRQRQQMTTLSGNITAIAIDGKFDDCQAMVKQAFTDPRLAGFNLSSANSINIGRLLPQAVYYFYAAALKCDYGQKIDFVIPCGNFGNMMGAVIAKKMGLNIGQIVVATNANDEFPSFMQTGCYQPIKPSRNCLSNAMNVGHPSNLARLVAIYGGQMDQTGKIQHQPDLEKMNQDIFAVSIDDETTCQAIQQAWRNHHLLLEPHGAVAWAGMEQFLAHRSANGRPVVVLETAHPAKFPDEINRLLGITPDLPPALQDIEQLPEVFDRLPTDYEQFCQYLLARA